MAGTATDFGKLIAWQNQKVAKVINLRASSRNRSTIAGIP
jgi:hypothetical protein